MFEVVPAREIHRHSPLDYTMYIKGILYLAVGGCAYEAQQRQSLGYGAPQQHVTPTRRDVEYLQKEE